MRAIAIISVVCAHTFEFLLPLKQYAIVGDLIENMFKFTQPLGALGVELFFVLSGFLIGSILIKSFITSVHFGWREVRTFLVRRWFRTLPNYWLILTVNIILYILLPLQSFEPYKLLYYIFAQNLWYPHPPFFFGEAWSLAVEEWFYLLLPFSLCIAYKLLMPADRKRFLYRAIISFIAVFALLRFFNAFHPVNGPDQDAGIRKVVFLRLDALAYGVLIAYFVYFKRAATDHLKKYLFAAGIISTCVIYYLISGDGMGICNATNRIVRFASDAFLYLLLPVSFAMLLPYANSVATASGKVFKRVVEFISKTSYSIYLVHYSLVYIPFFYRLKIENPFLLTLTYLAYWLIVCTLSFLLYQYFEKPLMKQRDKYTVAD